MSLISLSSLSIWHFAVLALVLIALWAFSYVYAGLFSFIYRRLAPTGSPSIHRLARAWVLLGLVVLLIPPIVGFALAAVFSLNSATTGLVVVTTMGLSHLFVALVAGPLYIRRVVPAPSGAMKLSHALLSYYGTSFAMVVLSAIFGMVI